jgi:hypothetical protein
VFDNLNDLFTARKFNGCSTTATDEVVHAYYSVSYHHDTSNHSKHEDQIINRRRWCLRIGSHCRAFIRQGSLAVRSPRWPRSRERFSRESVCRDTGLLLISRLFSALKFARIQALLNADGHVIRDLRFNVGYSLQYCVLRRTFCDTCTTPARPTFPRLASTTSGVRPKSVALLEKVLSSGRGTHIAEPLQGLQDQRCLILR